MDAVPSINSPSQPTPAAVLRPDQSRVVETGGVLAVRPDTPAPTPSSLAQQGAVTKSSLSDSDGQAGPTASRAPERVLKPYGVAMLPEGPTDTSAPEADDASSVDAANAATSEVDNTEEA
ncbi:hypothetical protein AB3Y40_09750 [Yoonia sp. R2331]|uniref:hypothetical protein n=1 Tax=Yoonia sp. R2331 TaxID=3237238 RepID=UPI0034E38B24